MIEHKLQFDFITTQKIIQKIGQIDQFKGEWKQLDKEENRYLRELKKIATIQSIGSSTRIEGNTLTDAEVASLIKNIKVNKLDTRDEQEVIGYYDTLEMIVNNYADMNLTAYNIHALHNLLLKYSGKDVRHRGKYKELSNQIVATYPDGQTNVIFKTTEPFLVEKEMSALVDWTNEAIAKKEIHPLIIIGVFVYEFLSIHPYQDGNGRLSRLLTNLLLIKNEYKFVLYVSLENIIEQKKAAYYSALMEGQKNRNTDKEKINQWMLFFLESLYELVLKLEQKLKVFRQLGAYLNDRQREILSFINEKQPVKLGDITKHFPQHTPITIRKDLQYLVNEYEIERFGVNRGTIYKIRWDKEEK
jgi:Fic family protein